MSQFPDETFYTNGYYASAGTYISAKAAEFMSKLDMLILIAALLVRPATLQILVRRADLLRRAVCG